MGSEHVVRSDNAITTYRYLRIGMVGAVVLLAAAIGIERSKAPDCWQTSISAYYYTPARAVFVGVMIAIGLALVVIKSRWIVEDLCLNFAGMLAPIVAVAPTTVVDVERGCWSLAPDALPRTDDALAQWVVKNIDNNFPALLIAGAIGWVVSLVIAVLGRSGVVKQVRIDRLSWISLAAAAAALLLGWWLFARWGDFDTHAHSIAAISMFVFLIVAVASKAFENFRQSSKGYGSIYAVTAVAMAGGGIAIWFLDVFGDHTVFGLEAFEIGLFALFWTVQTVENWNEETSTPTGRRRLWPNAEGA